MGLVKEKIPSIETLHVLTRVCVCVEEAVLQYRPTKHIGQGTKEFPPKQLRFWT
jgi:hypothetical protein